jgi:hypothetical protein
MGHELLGFVARDGLRRKEGIVAFLLPTLPASHALPPQHAKNARAGDPGYARLQRWAKLLTGLRPCTFSISASYQSQSVFF